MNEVVSFLLKEGYANNQKSAIKIYHSMSDQWLESILDETAKNPADVKFLKTRLANQKKGIKPNWPFGPDKKEYNVGVTPTGNDYSISAPVTRKKRLQYEVK
jgi:hypothetical protein